MRKLILENFWEQRGASFSDFGGAQYAASFGDISAELAALRGCALLCDFSFLEKFSASEDAAADFLDGKMAGDVMKLRYGRVLDTYLADADGAVVSEIFTADCDGKFLMFAESLVDGAAGSALADAPYFENLDEKTVLLSVDGPESWRVAKAVFGADILNLPYLGVEKYDFDGAEVFVARCSKTGEFGYWFAVDAESAKSFAERLVVETEKIGGRIGGFIAHTAARLESGFFNIYSEGSIVRSPLELGLQWQTDFEKETFCGYEKIIAERKLGVARRLLALRCSAPLALGLRIFDGLQCVGEVVAVSPAKSADGNFYSLAATDSDFAYPSLAFSRSAGGNPDVFGVSRPVFVSESLKRGIAE